MAAIIVHCICDVGAIRRIRMRKTPFLPVRSSLMREIDINKEVQLVVISVYCLLNKSCGGPEKAEYFIW